MLRDAFACSDDPQAVWPTAIRQSIEIDDAGLVLGAGTVLVRMEASGRRLTLDADRDRLLALLSVAWNRPVSDDFLPPIEAAAAYWQCGDKALANLRLVFASLPRLADPQDAYRLGLAETLLDKGLSPRRLMLELGLDPAALDLRKYPGQPRVPAGNGRESGRFGEGGSGDADEGAPKPADTTGRSDTEAAIIPVVDDGPVKPGGIAVVPLAGIDPLDPKGLNTGPPSPAEQQAIADTVNTILGARPEDLPILRPHPYRNYPHEVTGAILPASVGGYTTYYIRSVGQAPGVQRLVIDKGGHIYYTHNHYASFYPIDLVIKGEVK